MVLLHLLSLFHLAIFLVWALARWPSITMRSLLTRKEDPSNVLLRCLSKPAQEYKSPTNQANGLATFFLTSILKASRPGKQTTFIFTVTGTAIPLQRSQKILNCCRLLRAVAVFWV